MNKKRIVGFAVFFLIVAVALLFFGCAHQPEYNKPLAATSASPQTSPPAEAALQDDKTLMMVALSGGGTRAAAVSWKVLETLKTIPYSYVDSDGNQIQSTLANQIDVISGISGGSFAAVAWNLYSDEMDYFRQNFVQRNIQSQLLRAPFLPPWRGLRLISPEYDRINIAAELYDEQVFQGKTFGDLSAYPIVKIHATDLALGTRFTFTRESFRFLGSDLSSYPVGYACAASSAFPILLSPMSLLNYGPPLNLDEDVEYQLARANARLDLEKFFYARMRAFYNDKTNRYIPLADGGLVDNQGLQSILDEFRTNGIINKRLNDRDNPLRRLIIINVNAGTVPVDPSSKSPRAPGVLSVIEKTMVDSMDILSAKRWMEIKRQLEEIDKAKIDLGATTKSLSQLEDTYAIEVSFRNIKDSRVREQANDLPTSFYLNEAQLALIDRVVPDLVREDPDMQRLVGQLENRPAGAASDLNRL